MYTKITDILKSEIEKKYPDFFSSSYFDHIDPFYDESGLSDYKRFVAVFFKHETESHIEFGKLLFEYEMKNETKTVKFTLEETFRFITHERLLPDSLNLLYEGEPTHNFEKTPLWFQNIAHAFFKKVRLKTILDK